MATIKKENKIFSVTFCLKTLYNAIASGVIGITRTHLHINSKRKPYKKKQKKFIRPVLPHRTSIENRPNSINDRLVLNHWEMDTVVSGQAFNKCALLVLTERKTNKSIIRKIQAKTQNEVISVLDHLEKGIHNFKDIFRSITMDNGTEFLNYNGIEMSPFTGKKRTTTYYCHPYSAYERGQNENINKLIRYFIPKGSDISKYTDVFIQHVEDWINNYPRQKYNGLSANELYHLYVSGYNP